MNESQIKVIQFLSKALFERDAEVLSVDWNAILTEAKNQAVVQLVDSVLDKSLLSPEEGKAWKQAASQDIAKNIQIGYNHSVLHEWMNSSNIPYVILKGVASASYYPMPAYRSMGDVDFLVPIDYEERAGKVLEQYGLKPWNEEHNSHIVYRGPRMHYEMHYNLAGTPHGAAGDLVREFMKDIFEKAETKSVVSGIATLPSPFHHGLILLLHTCHHLTGEGVGLHHLCDWAVFENSFSETEFKELFEEKPKAIDLWRFAQILTRVSIKYLGADEKSWAVADDELVDALMEDILIGGNFGKKDKIRSMQTSLISERGKDGVGKTSMTDQFLKSGNEVVYHYWPQEREKKILLPFGWVFFGGRRVIRELTGKRAKTDVKGWLAAQSREESSTSSSTCMKLKHNS